MKTLCITLTLVGVILALAWPATAQQPMAGNPVLRPAQSANEKTEEERKAEKMKRAEEEKKADEENKAEEQRKIEQRKKDDEETQRKRELEEKVRAQVEERKREEERERQREEERERRRQRQREEEDRWNHDIFGPPAVVVPATPTAAQDTTVIITNYPSATTPTTSTSTPTTTRPANASGGGVYTAPATRDEEYKPQVHTAQRYYTRPQNKFGIVFAPSVESVDHTGVGVMWLNGNGHGASLWLAGSFENDDTVIDAPIPHDDYHTDQTQRAWGAEYLHGFGTAKAMAIVGIGLAVEQTEYTDVSNVTGWKWDGGSKSKTSLAGQFALQFQLSSRMGMYVGYDTTQKQFFGLTASF